VKRALVEPETPLKAQIIRLVHKAGRDAGGYPKLSARELRHALNENHS
jgi:hypothetical protein